MATPWRSAREHDHRRLVQSVACWMVNLRPDSSGIGQAIQVVGARRCPTVRKCTGSLESSNPLCVVRNGGEPMFLQCDRVTEFVSENGVPVNGWIATDTGWEPDAKVEVTVGGVLVSFAQHTEGRGKSGKAMLNLSVSGLASVVDPSAVGWASLISEDSGEAFSGELLPS